jgi:enterochelin esterase-like enzyme
MKNKQTFVLCSLFTVFAVLLIGAASVSAAGTVHFKINLDPAVGKAPLGGRLLIFMTNNPKPLETITPDFMNPNAVYISGTEITNLEAGKPVEIDADELAFPAKFSAAPAGEYQIMALLDLNHSYTYNGAGAGDLYSKVVKVSMPAAETELTLSQIAPERKIDIPANAKVIEFESPLLSAFWGRPVKMQASVVLPPSYDASKTQKYPTVYNIHGYGGTHLGPLRGVPDMMKQMSEGKRPEMIYVYLNANCPLGHHVFADSVNNGPWGTALVKEFIPSLEKQFRMDARAQGRFLTGHSSGGWSSFWVMISHPDFFGGTWSTSPDPVDFRGFTGWDLTREIPQNGYSDASGKEFNLVRFGGQPIMSVRQYAQQERVLGYYGGQFASFEAVFSPKGGDGQPMPIFDRETGVIDQFVAKSWEKYDISRILRENWTTLGPKLKGKLHIWVGTADTFHLDEAVRLLDAELKKLGSDAKIQYMEGRSHFDMYKDGLGNTIADEMYAVARPNAKKATK